MTIHYNEMLMMLWNQPKTVAVFAEFDKWDKNETNLIEKAKKDNLKVILIQKETSNFKNIISNKGIEQKASELDCEVVLWHSFSQEYNYERIKQDLNIKKVYVLSNNSDLKKINAAFDQKQVVEYDFKLNDDIKKSEVFLKQGKIKEYKKLNGFNFGFKGFVEHGNHIGRTINYPTANIIINDELILKEAVYLTTTKLPNDDKTYPSISAYWTNKNGINVFESHLLDFDQDIYGWGIDIEIIDFIRESIKVNSLEELKELLNKDKQYAINYFKGE
ncbi:riboflavin kinase [Mesoplasma tabanidae]|uniref:riboflavin kinase n=1 Tax=Mesoplasma tabanidae TaxID=219745 RepID=A0A2K8P490_9MOLU|nr:riboflavin kinase [Mesoplasma tabanidae]ATZ21571.1 riboflavin kinase/FAD synthetase [Mesoplasma tabanidae]